MKTKRRRACDGLKTWLAVRSEKELIVCAVIILILGIWLLQKP